jgi:hypothetical protein
MSPTSKMSIKQITDELDALDTQWEEFRAKCDGMSGSPGEWMIERMDELETELKRRGVPVPMPQILI